jgi:hypothetical protein
MTTRERDLRVSILLLAFVVTLALVTLSFQGNWPKVLRVGVSFIVYSSVLLLLARRTRTMLDAHARLPIVWFSAAGAAAGLASGLIRPVFRMPTLVLGTLGAALFLGTMHWVLVHYARRQLDRVVSAAPAGLSAGGRTQ